MQPVPPALIASYVVFSFFLLYQQLHARNFRAEGRWLRAAVGFFAVGGMIFAYGFLFYWGYTVSWMQAVLLLVLSLALKLIWFPIEARLGLRNQYRKLSVPGFVLMPACALVMLASLP